MPRHSNDLPFDGFEPYFEYVTNFRNINLNLGSHSACRAYYENWMRKYGAIIKHWSDHDIVQWAIRGRQSLKLCFSASLFHIYSQTQTSFKASQHYFSYYSMFHAMWAVLYLHPAETISSITAVNHSKMANVFHANFTSGKQPIISYNAKDLAADFKFLREYYSYRMPLNSPFQAYPELSASHDSLGNFLLECIQLSNLHSHMIWNSTEKYNKQSADVPLQHLPQFMEVFRLVNGKHHESRDIWAIDQADLRTQVEFLKRGVDLIPHSIAYDHMFDDFMTWQQETIDGDLLQSVRAFVWNAL